MSKPEKPFTTRIIGAIIVEATNTNPNAGLDGRPRSFPDNTGWISPVSIRRKYRDILADRTTPIYASLKDEFQLDPEKFCIFESADRGYDNVNFVEARNLAVEQLQTPGTAFVRNVDLRWFGGTLLVEKKRPSKKTKAKEGDSAPEPEDDGDVLNKSGLTAAGPISFGLGVSICPVDIEECDLTRKVPLRMDNITPDKVQCDLANGALKIVRHGLYYIPFGINPFFAARTQLSEKDVNLFKRILPHLFDCSQAANRPYGSLKVVHAWWAEHSHPLGSFNEHDFMEAMKPKALHPGQPSTSLADYIIPDKLPDGIKGEDLANRKG